MTEEEIDELIARGHELTGVEFKGAGPRTDKLLQAKVIRAAMGMSNRRDGGLVIIGVDDHGKSLIANGLSSKDLRTWQYDHVSTSFASHADPSINFELEVVDYRGEMLVVLHVQEFSEVPVLCKKPMSVAGKVELREGACYVRSLRKPETAEFSTQEDTRSLLDMALLKALRKWVSQAQSAGLIGNPAPPEPSDGDLFDSQLGGR